MANSSLAGFVEMKMKPLHWTGCLLVGRFLLDSLLISPFAMGALFCNQLAQCLHEHSIIKFDKRCQSRVVVMRQTKQIDYRFMRPPTSCMRLYGKKSVAFFTSQSFHVHDMRTPINSVTKKPHAKRESSHSSSSETNKREIKEIIMQAKKTHINTTKSESSSSNDVYELLLICPINSNHSSICYHDKPFFAQYFHPADTIQTLSSLTFYLLDSNLFSCTRLHYERSAMISVHALLMCAFVDHFASTFGTDSLKIQLFYNEFRSKEYLFREYMMAYIFSEKSFGLWCLLFRLIVFFVNNHRLIRSWWICSHWRKWTSQIRY